MRFFWKRTTLAHLVSLVVFILMPIASTAQVAMDHAESKRTPAQRFRGILHDGVGSGQLNPSPLGDRLVVSNIGSSGKDGVSMTLGPGGEGAQWDWLPLPPNAHGLTLEATGTLNGVSGTYLGSTSMHLNVDSFFDIVYDFAPLSTTARVEFYANGQHLQTVNGATGVVATAPALAHDCGKGGERVPRPLPLPYPYPPYPFPFPPLPWEPIPCFIWGWDTLQQLQLPDGTSIVADEIRILTEAQGLALDSVQDITLRGHAAPDSFFDIFIDAGECRWRSAHQGLGQAHMNADPNGHLVVSNIGSSGLDGVSIDLDELEIGRGFEWLPLPPMPPGSFLETQAFGGRPDTNDVFLGSLRLASTGTGLEITPDYSPLGSTMVQLQFFSDGQLVDIVSNVPMGTPIVTNVNESPGGCGKVYPDPTILCFYWEWPSPLPWQVPGGPGPIVADYVSVLAQNPADPFERLERLTVVGAIPNDLSLVTETNALHGQPGILEPGLRNRAGQPQARDQRARRRSHDLQHRIERTGRRPVLSATGIRYVRDVLRSARFVQRSPRWAYGHRRYRATARRHPEPLPR